MAKNSALPLLLVGGGALLVAAKSKKKKRKPSAKAEPSEPSTPPAGKDEPEIPDEPAPGVGNPAAVFCEEQGGKYVIRRSSKGGDNGVCVMPDGTEVPEWPFTRGEMAPGPAVDGRSAQGKVVVSKVGQAVTISFEEDLSQIGTVWEMASDTELKPERVLHDKAAIGSTDPFRRYFTFFMDKPQRGRAIFQLVKPRGEIVQGVTVSIEATEE